MKMKKFGILFLALGAATLLQAQETATTKDYNPITTAAFYRSLPKDPPPAPVAS